MGGDACVRVICVFLVVGRGRQEQRCACAHICVHQGYMCMEVLVTCTRLEARAVGSDAWVMVCEE